MSPTLEPLTPVTPQGGIAREYTIFASSLLWSETVILKFWNCIPKRNQAERSFFPPTNYMKTNTPQDYSVQKQNQPMSIQTLYQVFGMLKMFLQEDCFPRLNVFLNTLTQFLRCSTGLNDIEIHTTAMNTSIT